MCTAITYQGAKFFFGRNLDLDTSYGEEVVITPRRYPVFFRQMPAQPEHLAMIGMATVVQGQPLYYDGTNEAGLSMAGLNFPGNAVYRPIDATKNNLAPYELIPYLLGRCADVDEAMVQLRSINIAGIPFSDEYPLAPLHWILADRKQSVTIEQTCRGLEIFDNPYGILTNNPPFSYHCQNVSQHIHLTARQPINQFANQLELFATSQGLGAFGLPGDLSSPSRFVRATFTKWNGQSAPDQTQDIAQFFHVLDSVAFTAGCVETEHGYDKTVYSSCCDVQSGIYYYTTYSNRQITAVSLNSTDLNGMDLCRYPLRMEQNIFVEKSKPPAKPEA